jgi:TetR/AcrR family transcriptional regulator
VSSLYSSEKFRQQMIDESERGNILKKDPAHFFVDMISLITFPFAIKTLIMDRNQQDEQHFREFMNERKAHITEVLLKSIKV